MIQLYPSAPDYWMLAILNLKNLCTLLVPYRSTTPQTCRDIVIPVTRLVPLSVMPAGGKLLLIVLQYNSVYSVTNNVISLKHNYLYHCALQSFSMFIIVIPSISNPSLIIWRRRSVKNYLKSLNKRIKILFVKPSTAFKDQLW